MSAEETLYGLACQDMPVSGDEVREAMNAYAHELAEKQRKLAAPAAMLRSERMQGFAEGARAAADLVDPEVSCGGYCSCACHTVDPSPCDDCSGRC